MADERTINNILSEYEQLQNRASYERKKRIKEVNEKFPRMAEIDREIFKTGFDNMNSILKNPEKKEELNKKLKENLKRLKDEKSRIISENNIDPEYDKYKYRCSICSDTGYDKDGKKCICFKNRIINELYKKSNMSEMIKDHNFEKFSLDYYSDEKNSDIILPRGQMEKIFINCKNFCKNFESENKSILFYGPVGLGKTFLSSCIAKELMDMEKTVVYLTAAKLCVIYRDYNIGKNIDKDLIDYIYNADLLIIDDLGAEIENDYNKSSLFNIINERLLNNKKVVISTNLSISELTKMYSKRLTSRFYEFFNMYKFFGEDIRFQNFKNR